MKSKYHFVTFYGIWVMTLICAWPALAARSLPTWSLIIVVAMLFGFTSRGGSGAILH